MGDSLDAMKAILTDIAYNRRNPCGDYWDVRSNVLEAVEIINKLEQEVDKCRKSELSTLLPVITAAEERWGA